MKWLGRGRTEILDQHAQEVLSTMSSSFAGGRIGWELRRWKAGRRRTQRMKRAWRKPTETDAGEMSREAQKEDSGSDWEREAGELLEWTEGLNFKDYSENWGGAATTNSPPPPSP